MTHTTYVFGRKQTKPKNILIAVIIFLIFVAVGALDIARYFSMEQVKASSDSYIVIPQEKQQLTDLKAEFDKKLVLDAEAKKIFTGDYSYSYFDGDNLIEQNQDQEFNSASLYKLFVAHAALEMVDHSQASLNQGTIEDNSLDSCLRAMITVSDNPCGVFLQSFINPSSFNQVLNERGYECTDVGGYFPTTCASDVNKLLSDITNKKHLSEQSADYLYDLMLNQQITDRIPTGFDGFTVANKTADLNGYSHDAAIIEVDGQLHLLVVMTHGSNSPHSEISEFSKAIKATLSL